MPLCSPIHVSEALMHLIDFVGTSQNPAQPQNASSAITGVRELSLRLKYAPLPEFPSSLRYVPILASHFVS
jgi:hypothetical protein